jgi:hypothetical protein
LTPVSYAAGTLPTLLDERVASNIIAGHLDGEVGLVVETGARNGAISIAGSDSLPAQAVLYASAQDLLVGEDLYAGGAYLQSDPWHVASLFAQDVMRWILVGLILIGLFLKVARIL